MNTRTSALESTIFGVDVQSGDVRGDAPSYALVVLDDDGIERDVVTGRKLRRRIESDAPAIVATDNMYELAADKDALIHFLGDLPHGTRLVQVTGDEQPEPLSRVAKRHGVPYGKDPMQEAEAAARLAAANVGHEVTAFEDTTTVKVSRGRSTGKGGWSEDRHTRRMHGAVKRRAREIESTLDTRSTDEWMDVLVEAGVPAAPINDVDDALDNEQVRARNVVQEFDDGDRTVPVIEHPINYERADSGFESPPPRLGADTRAVFRELGYDEDHLDELAAAGVFGEQED